MPISRHQVFCGEKNTLLEVRFLSQSFSLLDRFQCYNVWKGIPMCQKLPILVGKMSWDRFPMFWNKLFVIEMLKVSTKKQLTKWKQIPICSMYGLVHLHHGWVNVTG